MDYGLFKVPFLLDFANFALDDTVIFIVALLSAVLFNGEAQGYAATFLGDVEPDKDKRHHFNALKHLDILGTICFFLGGFGWAKKVNINQNNLKKPFLHTLIIRFSGPIANLLLANIVCSIIWVLHKYEVQDRTFSIVVAVNLMVAVYSLIPIPPLAAGSLAVLFKKKGFEKFVEYYNQAGPYIIIAVVLIERITSVEIFGLLKPVVVSLFKLIYV
jgi:hypothetical protein